MSDQTEHDWQGNVVPVADPQTPVRHWVIDLPDGRTLAARGWREFLDMAKDRIEEAAEDADDDELADGLTFTIKVQDIATEDVCHE